MSDNKKKKDRENRSIISFRSRKETGPRDFSWGPKLCPGPEEIRTGRVAMFESTLFQKETILPLNRRLD